MLVTIRDKAGKFFQFDLHGHTLGSVAVMAEESIRQRADADTLVSMTIVNTSRFSDPDCKIDGKVSEIAWNKYPETKPVIVDKKLGSRFLVWRKGCDKLQFETWNGTGWAYNNNDITKWALITPPVEPKEENGKD